MPNNEKERIEALESLDILDTEHELAYDSLTTIVKAFYDVPTVAISLIDKERQWFKSIQGLDFCENTREVSFCGHTIIKDDLLYVEDATHDKRFHDNPLVIQDPSIRFYAGYPLRSTSGYNIGSLCIIDSNPRHIDQDKLDYLKVFAQIIEKEFFGNRKNNVYLKEIAKIQKMYINNDNADELFNYILCFLLKHTASEYGFIGAVHKDDSINNQPYLKTYAVNSIADSNSTEGSMDRTCFGREIELDDLDALSGHTLKTGEIVISNDPLHDPKLGPITKSGKPLTSYLCVPMYGNEGLIAMYGLANRKQGYSNELVQDLQAVKDVLSLIIESCRHMGRLNDMAIKDSLTQLYNRFYFESSITDTLNNMDAGNKHALLIIDLDYFKDINDIYGHPTGDELLKMFASRLASVVKKDDLIARFGGDEFAIFLNNMSSYEDAAHVAERIKEFSNETYQVDNTLLNCTTSIGIACAPIAGQSFDKLVTNADYALYKAKYQRDMYCYFSDELYSEFERQSSLENKIVTAFKNNQFYCYYQPQYHINTNRVIGAEALLRWDYDIPASVFIPKLESINLWKQLNHYVLDTVLTDIQNNIKTQSPFKIAINISLAHQHFINHLFELIMIVQQTNLPSNVVIEFEIAESSSIFSDDNIDSALKDAKKELDKVGINLAVDNFGVKYFSINQLIECHFNTIKLDKNYIDKLKSELSPQATAAIKAVMLLAKELGASVIAEGSEGQHQIDTLQELGIQYAQDCLFSKAIPMKDVAALLKI